MKLTPPDSSQETGERSYMRKTAGTGAARGCTDNRHRTSRQPKPGSDVCVGYGTGTLYVDTSYSRCCLTQTWLDRSKVLTVCNDQKETEEALVKEVELSKVQLYLLLLFLSGLSEAIFEIKVHQDNASK